MSKKHRDPDWAEAKQRCRLNQEEIQMAKELGFTPHKLVKNIPSPSQRWKAPVKEWVRMLHAERFGGRKAAARPSKPAAAIRKEDADGEGISAAASNRANRRMSRRAPRAPLCCTAKTFRPAPLSPECAW